MRILVYGGSFNPPHLGHAAAARRAARILQPDRLLLIPAADPPHKVLAAGSPDGAERLFLTRLAARAIPGAEACDLELRRAGPSYTADTMQALHERYPGAELWFLVGTDMLVTLDTWHDVQRLVRLTGLVAAAREPDETALLEREAERLRRQLGANILVLPGEATPAASGDVRALLPQRGGRALLDPAVYARIIQKRHYGARPELAWLREQTAPMIEPRRRAHVDGCEQTAVRLAARWGADASDAAEAAILHDATKKFGRREQLLLCRKYAMMIDTVEAENGNLLHAKTGAAWARARFGVTDAVYNAVLWHTTARPDMTLLEKIVFLADCMEPTRAYPGVDALRAMAFESLDRAVILALQQGLESLRRHGVQPHARSVEAMAWLLKETGNHIQ